MKLVGLICNQPQVEVQGTTDLCWFQRLPLGLKCFCFYWYINFFTSATRKNIFYLTSTNSYLISDVPSSVDANTLI